MRATPVAVVNAGGERFIVAGYESSDWVKNARAAGWGMLRRGNDIERVTLTAISADESTEILREFARTIRGGRGFLTVKAGASDAQFAAASLHHPVFRVDTDVTPRAGS